MDSSQEPLLSTVLIPGSALGWYDEPEPQQTRRARRCLPPSQEHADRRKAMTASGGLLQTQSGQMCASAPVACGDGATPGFQLGHCFHHRRTSASEDRVRQSKGISKSRDGVRWPGQEVREDCLWLFALFTRLLRRPPYELPTGGTCAGRCPIG